jgi:hypothetical protein
VDRVFLLKILDLTSDCKVSDLAELASERTLSMCFTEIGNGVGGRTFSCQQISSRTASRRLFTITRSDVILFHIAHDTFLGIAFFLLCSASVAHKTP